MELLSVCVYLLRLEVVFAFGKNEAVEPLGQSTASFLSRVEKLRPGVGSLVLSTRPRAHEAETLQITGSQLELRSSEACLREPQKPFKKNQKKKTRQLRVVSFTTPVIHEQLLRFIIQNDRNIHRKLLI
jgi:hypothetical protein